MRIPRTAAASGLLIATLVAACGGGGGASSTASAPAAAPAPAPDPAPAPAPTATAPTALKATSYAIATAAALPSLVNWNATPFATDGALMRTARGLADLDGDGVPDAVVAYGRFLEGTATTPLAIYKGAADGSFTDVTANIVDGTVPRLNHARKVIFGDFNGDGRNDVFVCAHGYDAAPFPGTTNAMLLSDGGKLKPVTDPWTQTVGFHHGCASADIDADGDLDLFVADQKGGSYFLINDGRGGFALDRTRVPATIGPATKPLFTAEMLDLDGDGHVDLLVGGDETYLATYVYWGNGTGTFAEDRRSTIPAIPGWQNPLVFAAADIDGDGKVELVVGRTKGTGGDPDFYKGYLVQVLAMADRTFTDVTTARAATTNASASTVMYFAFGGHATWAEWVWLADRDGDGRPDLVASDGGQAAGRYWARNLGGSFAAWVKL